MDLLSMTPYFWNIDLNTRSRVEALDRLALDVDVEVRVFEKNKGKGPATLPFRQKEKSVQSRQVCLHRVRVKKGPLVSGAGVVL